MIGHWFNWVSFFVLKKQKQQQILLKLAYNQLNIFSHPKIDQELIEGEGGKDMVTSQGSCR